MTHHKARRVDRHATFCCSVGRRTRDASSLGYVIPDMAQQNVASPDIHSLIIISPSSQYTEELIHVEKSMTGMVMCGGDRKTWRTRALVLVVLAASGCQ